MDPKVLIAIPTSEFGRRADFYDYVNIMDKPENTLMMSLHGSSPALSRNMMIEQALINECTHILFLDDDMAFGKDLLTKLLTHDVDIVSALYLQRKYPHYPLIFDKMYENGKSRFFYLQPEMSGLVEVAAAGLGACLIKIEVFEAMEKPWIRLGEIDPEQWCDDIGFFKRVKNQGFKVFCDLDCCAGHIATMVLRPFRNKEGDWLTQYDTNGQEQVGIPQLNPLQYESDGILSALTIEGWMSINELKWLAKEARDKDVIVEFGSHCGRSTRALADNTDGVVFAVDPWTGQYYNADNTHNPILAGSRWNDFERNLKEHIESGKVIPHKMKGEDFQLPINLLADMVFLDGDHRYEEVVKDIHKALKLVRAGGIICGHDYGNEWVGVKQAVDETFGNSVSFIDTIWAVRMK